MNGIDFVALQVRDINAAAAFLEKHLGWERALQSPPGAVVFPLDPIPVAVREPLEDLPTNHRPGVGTSLWVQVDDTRTLAAKLTEAGVALIDEPEPGPFGWSVTIVGPEGHHLTLHDGDGQ